MGLESEIYVSTLRCFMSTFLLKSDGGTPQNIHFNVYVIVMRSIHRQTLEMWNLSISMVSPAITPEVFGTPFILVNLCRIGKVRRSRKLLNPFTAPMTLRVGEHPFIHEAKIRMWNRLGIPSVTRFTALKMVVINAKKPGYPCWLSNTSTWFKGKCTLFYSCFGNCQRLPYKILSYKVCIICPKLIAACKIHCKSPSWQPDGLTMLDCFTVHETTLSAYIRESAYVRSHVGCGRVHQTAFASPTNISKMQKRCK